MGSFVFSTLENLQTKSHLHLLNAIDDLRAQGLGDFLPLPQLIVCGDQSSGKSSVLEAISGVPFPKKDNLCTRFATEVILRRGDTPDETRATVSINPGASRSESDRQNLLNFNHVLASMDDLSATIQRAKDAMGLGDLGNAFSTDVLRLEITGPRIPQLTIVDLPGLIHSANKLQTIQDVELVTALVEGYMQQERSIILAIVSAKNDYANQIVLKKARAVDPDGMRTLGVITKPDCLHSGSDSEGAFLGLAKNQDVKFDLGWHVVRNVDSNNPGPPGKSRDEQEQEFFSKGNWSSIDRSLLGIDSLRERLSTVLFGQIRRELPNLIGDIERGILSSQDKLEKLGRARSTEEEHRLYLSEVGQSFYDLCRAGCDGNYENSFFANYELQSGANGHKRLRAMVQNDSESFTRRMLTQGSTYPINFTTESDSNIARKEAIRQAKNLLRVGRGRELPGTFNPLMIGELFRGYSSNWRSIARQHVEQVWRRAKDFVDLILQHVTEEDVSDKCYRLLIDSKLNDMLTLALERLDECMDELKRHPITYNDYFTENVKDLRNQRIKKDVATKLRDLVDQRRISSTTAHVPEMTEAVMTIVSPAIDTAAAEDIVDHMYAYYKVAIKRLIDNIPAQIIEPIIISKLPQLFTSSTAWRIDKHLVADIAGESMMKQGLRSVLITKLNILHAGAATCKQYRERLLTRDGDKNNNDHNDDDDEDGDGSLPAGSTYEATPESVGQSVKEEAAEAPVEYQEPDYELASEEVLPCEPDPPIPEEPITEGDWMSFKPISKKDKKKKKVYGGD